MGKILLINPGHDDEHEIYKHVSYRAIHRDPPPLGALCVATYLDKHGYEVEILDTHIEEKYLEILKGKISENNYIFVGITVIIGKFLKNAVELSRLIKSMNPELPIVWGGIMASIYPDELFNEYPVDYIVRYEGEETACELATALEKGSGFENIDGLSFRGKNGNVHNPPRFPKLNLDEYPIPKWELLGSAFNKEQVPYFYLVMSSRGCPFNCTFCYKHSVDKVIQDKVPPWRARSTRHIIDEIDYIHAKTGTTVFTFGDDNFFVNKKRTLEILAYFRKRGFYIEECIGHLNCVDDEIIEAMGGIVQTFIFSIETGSPRLQTYIDKNLDLKSIPDKIRHLYAKGIVTNSPFIVGFPTEETEDLRKNIEIMIEIKKHNPFARGKSYLFLPLPKTKLFDTVEWIYSIKLPDRVTDYEEANIWVENVDDPIGKKYRPWMADDRFNFLVRYCLAFNDVFKPCNLSFNDRTRKLFDEHADLKSLFAGCDKLNHPKGENRTYVLDRVLKGDKIDLINDLKGK